MAIRVRNKNMWENENGEFVEFVGEGSILENPYNRGCKRKLNEQFKKYLMELPANSPQWKRIEELRKLHDQGEVLNLLCTCYPDPCHSNVISDAITGKIKPNE
ncbi:DUF4326 domain-containing protein [Methanobacterium alcaliphilum]|uniref:DUF4326 domain-containing protein n=1 Tax=Methanobacterium alcaliphilum TaxID=392018 RepID=UPI00200AAD8E|nr:DUF4326 domain-containing protein [Methanobacterium alcaliphilum]